MLLYQVPGTWYMIHSRVAYILICIAKIHVRYTSTRHRLPSYFALEYFLLYKSDMLHLSLTTMRTGEQTRYSLTPLCVFLKSTSPPTTGAAATAAAGSASAMCRPSVVVDRPPRCSLTRKKLLCIDMQHTQGSLDTGYRYRLHRYLNG